MGADERAARIDLKLARAKKHISDLDSVVQVFRESQPYRLAHVDDLRSGRRAYRIEDLKPVPSDVPLIAGDAVHSLRVALDHLAWELVLANGQQPGRWTAFPVCDDVAQFKRAATKRTLGMSNAAKAAVAAAQPYQDDYEYLSALRGLDNIDKHRSLIAAMCAYNEIEFAGSVVDLESPEYAGTGLSGIELPAFQLVAEGDELFTIAIPERSEDPELKIDIAFHEPAAFQHMAAQWGITLWHPIPPQISVVETLTEMSKLVGNIVEVFRPLLE